MRLKNFFKLQAIALKELLGINHGLAIIDWSKEGSDYIERITKQATAKIEASEILRPHKAKILQPNIFNHHICKLELVTDFDPAEIVGEVTR